MSLRNSPAPHYLSIEDVLATNERVSCKFTNELPRMGFLDPSSDNENLSAGTTIELPFWLAEALSSKKPPMVAIDIPKVYKEAYREILKADASAVDLHKLGMFYYDFGCYLASFDPKGDVGNSLVSTFRSRFRHIMDLSQNSQPDPMASSRLDRLERALLGEGQVAGGALDFWCRRSARPLRPAHMLAEHLKRKRSVAEQN